MGVACKPKDQDGLDIIDLEKHNNALLMKHLNKFYNKAHIPWVSLTWTKLYTNSQTPPQARCPVGSFWWKEIIKLFKVFIRFATCAPRNGITNLFWAEPRAGVIFKEAFPQLYSFIKKPKCSIRFFLDQEMDKIFSLPLSLSLCKLQNN